MKTNQEILDEFGLKVIEYVYDDNLKYAKDILSSNTKWGFGKEYSEVFSKLESSDKKIILNFLNEQIKTGIFSFLSLFEENRQFKLYYEKEGKQINLVEITEMLKAEPIIENGWIERFSKELNNEK